MPLPVPELIWHALVIDMFRKDMLGGPNMFEKHGAKFGVFVARSQVLGTCVDVANHDVLQAFATDSALDVSEMTELLSQLTMNASRMLKTETTQA